MAQGRPVSPSDRLGPPEHGVETWIVHIANPGQCAAGTATGGPAMRGIRIQRDRSAQVLGIELPEDRESVWDDREEGPVEPVLSPSIPGNGDFVSAAVLAEKAKQFDDGLYACVERAAQTGIGRFPGKSALLRSLAGRVAGDPVGEAISVVIGAAELGGARMNLGPRHGARSIISSRVFAKTSFTSSRSCSTRGFLISRRSFNRTGCCRPP